MTYPSLEDVHNNTRQEFLIEYPSLIHLFISPFTRHYANDKKENKILPYPQNHYSNLKNKLYWVKWTIKIQYNHNKF